MTKIPSVGPTKLPIVLPLNTALISCYSSLFLSSLSPSKKPISGHVVHLSGYFLRRLTPRQPLSGFRTRFPPWENHEPSFLFNLPEEPAVLTQFSYEPVSSNSGSDAQNPVQTSGSDDSNRNEPKTLSSGSDEPSRGNLKNKRSGSDDERRSGSDNERKRRRMMSNRESARRSRMRKQKHLENLRNQANRLKLGNREQMNRLRFIVCQTQHFSRENEYLRSEAAVLRQRLWDIRQVLVVRQLQQMINPMHMQINHPTL